MISIEIPSINTPALNHSTIFRLSKKLVRQIVTVLRQQKLNDTDTTLILNLVCVACLSKRKLLALDNTVFASRMISLIQRSCQAELFQAYSAVQHVFELPWVNNLLDDPTLPGWIYQHLTYQSRSSHLLLPKEIQVQSTKASDVSTNLVAPLTQWFTPKWICKYLVEQALPFKENTLPQKLRVLDPACGTGHLLVEIISQLFKNSTEHTAQRRLHTILQDQIFGLDIDARVIEVAAFSIYLLCRDLAPVCELSVPSLAYFSCIDANSSKSIAQNNNSEAIGSLWLGIENKPENMILQGLCNQWSFDDQLWTKAFSAIITNPPYLSHRFLPTTISDFLKEHYPNSKYDLYAAFISLCTRLLDNNGKMSMICQQSFLSLPRYKALREELSESCQIESLVQLGSGSFCAGGEKINNAIFVAKRSQLLDSSVPITTRQLLTKKQKQEAELIGIDSLPFENTYLNRSLNSKGQLFYLNCSENIAKLFAQHLQFGDKSTGIVCTNGLFTCNNSLFVKYRHELKESELSEYVPYDKGGGFKWFKTTPYMVHWINNGNAIRQYRLEHGQSQSLPGEKFYFQPGITYSYIGTKGFKARMLSPNSIFDIASSSLFSEQINLLYLLGLLNSSLMRLLLGVINPTINFQIGDIRKLPFAHPTDRIYSQVIKETEQAVNLAKLVDSFDHSSPAFTTPILHRYAKDQNEKAAYQQYLAHVEKINTTEFNCQSEIDSCIFELYKISNKDQQLVLESPWVARSNKPLCSALSFENCLKQLTANTVQAIK